MRSSKAGVAGFSVAIALLAGGAYAEEMKFSATLTGGEEVPPVETGGTGTADVTYDTESMELTWTAEFSGLSGPATAAHFHGPAQPGENAGPVVPVEDLESPSEGTATLTQEHADQLTAGNWYLNFHTEANPDGEIRGQVTPAM
jgi:hypothetical protein